MALWELVWLLKMGDPLCGFCDCAAPFLNRNIVVGLSLTIVCSLVPRSPVDETTTDIICIKCKKDDSELRNEIVLCDSCGIGERVSAFEVFVGVELYACLHVLL